MSDRDPLVLTVDGDMAGALRAAVTTGEYASVDHALADALRSWHRRHEDRADALATIKARIRASIDDPRPSLSEADVDARLDAFFEAAERRADAAA